MTRKGLSMKLNRWLRTWWLLVPSPRVFSILYAVTYFFTILGGIMTYFYPPYSLQEYLTTLSINLICFSYAFGGLVAAYAGAKGAWKLERIAIYSIMLAILVYGATVLHNANWSAGNYYAQLLVIVLAFMLFVVRLAMIWQLTYKPRTLPITIIGG